MATPVWAAAQEGKRPRYTPSHTPLLSVRAHIPFRPRVEDPEGAGPDRFGKTLHEDPWHHSSNPAEEDGFWGGPGWERYSQLHCGGYRGPERAGQSGPASSCKLWLGDARSTVGLRGSFLGHDVPTPLCCSPLDMMYQSRSYRLRKARPRSSSASWISGLRALGRTLGRCGRESRGSPRAPARHAATLATKL